MDAKTIDQTVIDTPSNKMIAEMSAIMAYHLNIVQGLQKVIDFFYEEIDEATQYIISASQQAIDDITETVRPLEYRNEVINSYCNGLQELQRYHQVEHDFVQSEIERHIANLSDEAN